MTQEEYLKYHKDLCDRARELSQKKNHDYADPDRKQDDPLAVFANFMQCQNLGICNVESGFLVRLSDKFSRLANLLAEGHSQAVSDESIEDTVLDVINYVCLLMAYRRAVSDVEVGKIGRELVAKFSDVVTRTTYVNGAGDDIEKSPPQVCGLCTCDPSPGRVWSEKFLSYACTGCHKPIKWGS